MIATKMSFIISNCRSLKNKMESLNEYFIDANISFSLLTETWMTKENDSRIKNDLHKGYGLGIISKARKGSKGGGVAIVWKNSMINFTKMSLNFGSYEVVAAKGKIEAANNSIYVFAVYYPPTMKADRVREMNEKVCIEIEKIKINDESAKIIIGGDMNNKDCTCFNEQFPDIFYVPSPPTRGNACLDECHSNCKIEDVSLLPPLESSKGQESDHSTVMYTFEMSRKKKKYLTYYSRKVTKEGEDRFCELVNGFEWGLIDRAGDVDGMTEFLHAKIEEWKELCFPLRRIRKREDQDPWVTPYLDRLANKKRKEFGKNKKSDRWKRLQGLLDERMKQAKTAYYDREVERLFEAKNKKGLAYSALKGLGSSERPKSWSLTELDPERDVNDLLEETAQFFCRVSNENPPAEADKIKWTYDRPVYELTAEQVEKRIRQTKKPGSTVPGDIPPRLINRVAKVISEPVSKIFNSVPKCMIWPDLWRTEYQTIIPKKTNPSNLSEVRNLSCTNFLSKVLETFVIDSIRSEVIFSELQYGGLKGCGTDNFLAEVWNNVLESMEDEKTAVALMSLDFSKAFNRINHQACLDKLASKNASNQSIGMIFAFLNGRKMMVRLGEKLSTSREVTGGSPQGTKLGNLLFCLTIDDIVHEEKKAGTELEGSNNLSPEMAIPHEYRLACSTPKAVLDDSFNPNPYGMRKKTNVIEDTMIVPSLPDQEYDGTDTWEVGYVDDINVGETLRIEDGIRTISTKKENRIIRSKGCEKMFQVIESNGNKVGLLLNPLKTQLLCFSAAKHLDIQCEINVGGRMIKSEESLKILGFVFGRTPTVNFHVECMIGKFNRALWLIRHLIRAGLRKDVIVRAYVCMIRPIIEYACNIYGPMLSACLKLRIEGCQKRVLRMIYGYENDYSTLLERAEIITLEDRRKNMFRKFCIRMSKSARFSAKWLPKIDPDSATNLRNSKVYIEFNSRTDRLYRSPIFTMRRELNTID